MRTSISQPRIELNTGKLKVVNEVDNMSSNFSSQWTNRQRLLSNNSADLSLETSLVGLLYVNSNNVNPNGTDGGSKNPMSPQVSKNPLSPSSQSQRAKRVESSRLPNANDALQIIQLPVTGNSRAPSSTPSGQCSDHNPVQYQTQELSELLDNYLSPVENSTLKEEECPQRRRTDRALQHLQLPTPESARNPIALPQREKLSNGDNDDTDLKDQLQNCVIATRTMKPIMQRTPQPSSSMEDYYDHGDEHSCPASPNGASSCVSSLSADESQYHFSDLASAVRVYCENEPPSRMLSSRRECVPHQLTFTSLRSLNTLSTQITVDRENSARVAEQSRTKELLIHSAEGLDSQEAALQQHSQHYCQGSDVRSLELKRPLSYNQQTISSSMTPNIKQILHHSKMHRYYHAQSTELNEHNYESCNQKGPTCQNHTITTKPCHQSKKPISRNRLSTKLSSLCQPALLTQRSASTSATSLTNTTTSSSQCGSNRQNNHHSTPTRNIFILGGENSTASACNRSLNEPPLTVNGMVVKGIKHRRRHIENTLPVIGGPGNVAVYSGNSIYKAAPTSLESPKSNSSPSFTHIDDTTSRSYGITESSMNGITSLSSGTTTQGKRRRRRRAKDEFRFFVGKLVPGPVKVMKTVLTKKKSYDLERSRSGCLT